MTRRNWTRRTSYSRAKCCATHTLDLRTRSRRRRCRSKPKCGRTCNARFLRKRCFAKDARALDWSLTCNRELCLSQIALSQVAPRFALYLDTHAPRCTDFDRLVLFKHWESRVRPTAQHARAKQLLQCIMIALAIKEHIRHYRMQVRVKVEMFTFVMAVTPRQRLYPSARRSLHCRNSGNRHWKRL